MSAGATNALPLRASGSGVAVFRAEVVSRDHGAARSQAEVAVPCSRTAVAHARESQASQQGWRLARSGRTVGSYHRRGAGRKCHRSLALRPRHIPVAELMSNGRRFQLEFTDDPSGQFQHGLD